MKKLIVLSLVGFVFLFSCATMQQATNIQNDKEFIVCEDPSCDVCGGTGELGCAACDEAGHVHCTTCGGDGDVTCNGSTIITILGLTCKNGYAYPVDPENYEGYMDEEGYALDSATEERMECPACYGTGIEECPSYSCTGGLVTCTDCQGSGRLMHGSWNGFSTCLSCGERLPENATNCTNCGLNAVVYKCKECGESTNDAVEACPSCGAGA